MFLAVTLSIILCCLIEFLSKARSVIWPAEISSVSVNRMFWYSRNSRHRYQHYCANISDLCLPCSAPTICIGKLCTWLSCTQMWGPHLGAWSLSGAEPVCWRPTCAACRTCCPCSTGNGTSSSTSVPRTSLPGYSPSTHHTNGLRFIFFNEFTSLWDNTLCLQSGSGWHHLHVKLIP